VSATVAPTVASTGPGSPGPGALAPAAGLELLGEVAGSGYKAGIALVRRSDGQVVQVGPLMYALLEEVDGRRDADALASALSERLGRRLDRAQVVKLAEKLAQQGLLAGFEEHAPPKSNPLLALRWKVVVSDPKVTNRITRPFLVLFRPWLMLPALAAFAAVLWFVLIHHGVAAATAEAFDRPELLLLVLGLTIGSAALHEIGHASACRYSGARPGAMGAGIYIVWPAFYTDVTDAYRLPRRGRLRTDCGGIYFNAVIAVVTLGAWVLTDLDALLLLIGVQLLEIVRNLSPVFRSDGYHILSDATGVPDLFAHVGPTLRRLLPWRRREPSALTGRARLLVTAWVLVIVPVLLGMALLAILLFPRLAATAWESASAIVSAIPDHASDGDVAALLASGVRLLGLALPLAGVAYIAQRLVRGGWRAAMRWSEGRPVRRGVVAIGLAGLLSLVSWAWWPGDQYTPVHASDDGTLVGAFGTVTDPASAVRPSPAATTTPLAPGRHLAMALIPRGGPTEEHPALYVIKDEHGGGEPTILASADPPVTGGEATPAAAASAATASPAAATSTAAPTAGTATTGEPAVPTGRAVQLPFTLPDEPGEGDTQALAVNTTDGGIVYKIAYALVTVDGGEPVDNENSAYALASCDGCTTLAASFQVVLVIGQSDRITPINVAQALNVNCPRCITTAIAKQLVISLRAAPSEELLQKLTEELRRLDAIDPSDSPADVLREIDSISEAIQRHLDESGLTYPDETEPATASPTPATSETPAPAATASPGATAVAPTPTPTAEATTTATPEPTATETPAPTQTATPAATPTAASTPEPTATP
jgi:putative peptide zinc metalloprotease protein